MARVVYRIVRSDPPALDDFLSDEARGRVSSHDPPEIQRLRSGRSVYLTEAQARRRAKRMPVLGHYIAAIRLPRDAAVRLERTLPGSPGHYTLWGDAALLLAPVVTVVPV
jgi:hypothetical protein